MWQVPTIDSAFELSQVEISEQLHLREKILQIGEFEHILSHRVVSFTVFTCSTSREPRFMWIKRGALEELPLASAQRKVLSVHCAL